MSQFVMQQDNPKTSNHTNKVLNLIADSQSQPNTRFAVSELNFYFRLFYSVYVMLFCIIKLFVPQDFDFQFKLFTIPFLIIIQVVCSENVLKSFFLSFPSIWALQLIVHTITAYSAYYIDLIILCLLGCVILGGGVLELRNTKMGVRFAFTVSLIAVYINFKYLPHLQVGSSIKLFLQVILLYPFFGIICALLNLKLKASLKRFKKFTENEALSQSIYFAQLLRTVFLSEYKYIPTLALLLLIIQCVFQILLALKQKEAFIYKDYVVSNKLAFQIDPNTIRYENYWELTHVQQEIAMRQENSQLTQSHVEKCYYCGVQVAQIVFFDCMHQVYCLNCAKKKKARKPGFHLVYELYCPICKSFKEIQKRYELINSKTFFQLKTGKKHISSLKSIHFECQVVETPL